MDVAGKTIWVTGASSGIGRGLSLALAEKGARLILSGRNEAALAEVAAACPGSSVIAFEVTDYDALPTLVARAEAVSGRIDLLVNNAGMAGTGPASEMTLATLRTVMEIDFFAPVRLTQLVLPAMLARGQGHIAIVSSLSGKLGVPSYSAYCAAKHALMGWFDSLRTEVDQRGIKVTTITPGFVQTDITNRRIGSDGSPLKPSRDAELGITPAESAAQIIAGFAADQPEIPAGRGSEMDLLSLKRQDPDALLRYLAEFGRNPAILFDPATAPARYLSGGV